MGYNECPTPSAISLPPFAMRLILLLLIVTFVAPRMTFAENAIQRTITFADDVQPILRRNCYRCHGTKNQESDLQLNDRSKVYGDTDADDPIIAIHDANASLLIRRLVDEDYGDIMPPDGKPLTAKEIETLRVWIDQGAAWPDELADPKHWAYQPIKRPDVPTSGAKSSATPIDQFVLRRLATRGMKPSTSLDRPRLIRRVSLALTGIPPTPQEVDAFVADPSKNAYEKVVDRLLQSQRYGERWAVPWLDLARYADSNGFQADQIRDNWAYRDWVIRAFNDDLPFSEFVIDQIAGDLRPNPTSDQKIATGFHRMTTCNVEAGVHPEANRTNQIVDRVNTTGTVFLGATLECAQCHDHKYDPITQKDYYRFFAYFNNTPLEVEKTGPVTYDFYGPTMDLPMDAAKKETYQQASKRITELESNRKTVVKAANRDFNAWKAALCESAGKAPTWTPVVPVRFETTGGEDFEIQSDGAVLLSGKVPPTVEHKFTFKADQSIGKQPITAIRVDLLTDKSLPNQGPGRGDPKRTNVILSELTCELVDGDQRESVPMQNAVADYSQSGWDVSQAIDGNRKKGWAIGPKFSVPHWASFVFSKPVALKSGSQELTVTLGQFFGRGRVAGKPRISICTGDPSLIGMEDPLAKLAAIKEPKAADRKKLRDAFDKQHPETKAIDDELASLQKQVKDLRPDTTLVMTEMDQRRETFVMLRGDYENLADKVTAGVPEVLPQTDESSRTGDRMELALWLTSPNNPLLARVTVNRWWSELFGTGIVNTPEDFGTQAEDPSHPRLLDWLAAELIESGWSMKHVHKTIVMSQTFCQESRMTADSLAVDPNNRWLARGPRFRLPAESVRDNALAISGLLSGKMYGPPIMPYQPDKIWRSVGRNQPKWVAAENEDRFRRGVYVICKRAAPYPSFINFDAPNRGACTVDRGRTNTPLQALTLLNDPAYAEMALALADRVLANADLESDDQRLAYAMKLAVARDVSTLEVNVLRRLLTQERARIAGNPELIQQRTKPPFKSMELKSEDRAELSAWYAVSNAILNLDETISQ